MIGGKGPIRADRMYTADEASRDDMFAAGVSLVLCMFTVAAVVVIMWLSV